MPSSQEIRKTHVARIFGVNRDGERVDDMWIDIERVDVMVITTQTAKHLADRDRDSNSWQEVQITLHWDDEGGHDDQSADDLTPQNTIRRRTRTLKVFDAANLDPADWDDPDEYVPVEVIEGILTSGGGEISGAQIAKNFINSVIRADNSDNPADRTVTPRRFTHWDTNVDADAQAALDADPTLRVWRVPDVRTYMRESGTEDEEQYVEHEVIERLHRRDTSHWQQSNGADTEVDWILDTRYLYNESREAKLTEVGEGGINPPFRLDPFQNIINVNWGGLAVHYHDNSCTEIELPTAVSNKKGTFALWFRVPQSTIDAAVAEANGPNPGNVPMFGVIPLVVFGTQDAKLKSVSTETETIGTEATIHHQSWSTGSCSYEDNPGSPVPGSPITSSIPTGYGDVIKDLDPSYIGIDVKDVPNESDTGPRLAFNLIAGGTAVADNYYLYTAEQEWPGEIFERGLPTITDTCTIPPTRLYLDASHNGPFGELVPDTSYDIESVLRGTNLPTNAVPQSFHATLETSELNGGVSGVTASGFSGKGGTHVVPGVWHCLIFAHDVTKPISVKGGLRTITDTLLVSGDNSRVDTGLPFQDDTEGSRTSSASQIFMNLDRTNLTKKNLSCYWPTGYADPNAVLTPIAMAVVNSYGLNGINQGSDHSGNFQIISSIVPGVPRYTYTPTTISMGNTVGFPTTQKYVSRAKAVDMACFQYFAGVVADTKNPDVVRAFVSSDGRPVDFSRTKDLFGKSPEIALPRRSNWKKAINAGSLHDPDPGDPSDGTVVGKIDDVSPNPELGK